MRLAKAHNTIVLLVRVFGKCGGAAETEERVGAYGRALAHFTRPLGGQQQKVPTRAAPA